MDNGYICEEHKVITEDNYVLTMHRIPRRRNESLDATGPRTPIFLQHGLLSSSASWVLNTPHKAAGEFRKYI